MKMLLASDKFKGSLSAREVCQAIEKGLTSAVPPVEVMAHPMADGGDGSLEVLSEHLRLDRIDMLTVDPLGRKISTHYLVSPDAAFIELASASGLVLLKEEERDPYKTSTLGTGKMVLDAIDRGLRKIYLFLGGSATNDAGTGIASALGCLFLDENQEELAPVGENLSRIHSVLPSTRFASEKVELILLCDVTNGLYGWNGAAQVYARQKGASEAQVTYLDSGLAHFNNVLFDQTGEDMNSIPGVGAAGGIGASMIALFGARLEKGFDAIARLTGLEKRIQWADYVVSGEGKLDVQSLQGKVIDGVAELCKQYNKPLTLFVGKNELDSIGKSLEVDHVFAISERAKDLKDAMDNGAIFLEELAASFLQKLPSH